MKAYMKPIMESELFTANEYVAACGTNTVYKFVCDAGWTGITGSTVYTNGADGIMGTDDDVRLGTYGKCGGTHDASTTDEFIDGYLEKNILGIPSGVKQQVIIWRGDDGKNIHCTKNIHMETWETAKS